MAHVQYPGFPPEHDQPLPITPLAALYARWTLDPIVDVALGIAHDVIKRPRVYRTVSHDTLQTLSRFRSFLGTHPPWPSAPQRLAICAPQIGGSDSKPADKAAPFHQAAAALRDAAVAYSERVHDTGEPMLRRAFADAGTALVSYLSTMEGNATAEGQRLVADIFDRAREVLMDGDIARAFGLPAPETEAWPIAGAGDGNGAALMEEVTKSLQPAAGPAMSHQHFTVLQRAANSGALTIAAISAGCHDDNRAVGAIAFAYSWATALRALPTK
jgi:hypothetical protein